MLRKTCCPKHVFPRSADIIFRFDVVDIPFQIQLDRIWGMGLERIISIYDVACSFKKRCFERCKSNKFSPLRREFQDRLELIPENDIYMQHRVNHFHQYGHNPECADEHSLCNTRYVGMFTGEDIETAWAIFNLIQYVLREMDAGGRVDALTAHMLQFNRQKILQLGELVHFSKQVAIQRIQANIYSRSTIRHTHNIWNTARTFPCYRRRSEHHNPEQLTTSYRYL